MVNGEGRYKGGGLGEPDEYKWANSGRYRADIGLITAVSNWADAGYPQSARLRAGIGPVMARLREPASGQYCADEQNCTGPISAASIGAYRQPELAHHRAGCKC